MRGDRSLIAFVEMPSFVASRAGVLTDEEVDRVMHELQIDPRQVTWSQALAGFGSSEWLAAERESGAGEGSCTTSPTHRKRCILLYAYSKSRQQDVTPAEKRLWRTLVNQYLKG